MENFTSNFKLVGVVARLGSAKVVDSLRILLDFLKLHNIGVILEKSTGDLILDNSYKVSSGEELAKLVDLVIVVGGDGSLLSAVRKLSDSKTPIVGINRGHLGFLTDIAPDNIEEELSRVLAGEYDAEERLLLEVEVWRDGKFIASSLALNEVVLRPASSGRMIAYSISIDNKFVCEQRGDGLIVSTPTGSTAYAMSAGGTILHPKLKVLELVPILPQTLSSRPIVISSKSKVNIVLHETNGVYPQIICDGQEHIPCKPNDVLLIKEAKSHINLLHPKQQDFFKICRTKLGWNRNLLNQDRVH